MQKLTRSLLALGAVIGLAACGDDVTVTPPTPAPAPTVTGVTVSPASTTIKIGESVIFSAALQTTGTVTNTAVTWASANPAIATVVAASGQVTGVAVGTTTIRATSSANASATGAGSVTVVAPGVQSVSVTPSAAAVTVGQSFTAVANVTRDAGVAGTVNWASSATSIATVSAAGVVTGVAPGTAVITATSTADATKAASLSVTVTQQANALQSLTVTPGTVNLGPGGQLTLTTIATLATGATVAYANSTSNAAVATVTATGANPVITGVSNGTAVITIQATGSGTGLSTNSISQTVTVNINAAAVSISSVTTCTGGPPCTVVPVNLAATMGQIEATLNINSGSQTIDRVVVYIDSDSAAAQVFGVNGAPNAPVTLSINTAYFDPTTYAPRHLNGVHNMTAKIYPVGPNPSPTASNTVQFTLTNPDVVYFNPTGIAHLGNSAVDGGGTTWWKGGFTFTGHVVNYSNAITGVTYTSTGAASAYSDNPDCLTATGTTGPAFTATFSCSLFEGPQNLANSVGVTYAASYTLTAPPTTFMVVASPGFVPGNPVYAVVTTNEDNVGPRTNTPSYNNVNIAGWHGNGSAGATVWGSIFPGTTYSDAATDLGIGVSAVPTMTEVTTGLTPITAANQLAQTPTPAPYFLRGNAVADDLGNAGFSTGSVCTGCFADAGVFGVDLVVTDAQYSNRATSALANLYPLTPVGTGGNATIYTAAGWGAVDGVTDQVAADAIDVNGSGLDNATALTQKILRSNPAGVSACLASGAYGMGAGFGGATLGDNYVQSGPQQLDCGLLAGARVGRYSWSSYVADRAGNVLIPRQGTVSSVTPLDSVYVIIDEAAPNITGIGFQTALYTGGQPAAFSFSANDDYEIKDGLVTLTYGNGSWVNPVPTLTYNYGAALFTPASFAASPWDNTWVNVLNGQTLTLNYLLGNFETVGAAGAVAGFVSSGIINNAAANVRDWAGQTGAGITAPILSTQVGATAAVAWGTVTASGGSGPAGNMSTWHILAKTATTITVEQIGVTSTSLAACGRVDIYEANAGAAAGPLDAATTTNLIWTAQANFTQATVPFTDNGLQRFYSYTITIPASVASGFYTAVCVQSGRGLGTELF